MRLCRSYIAVRRDRQWSFGGSQTWSKSRTMQKYGCGVVAGLDVISYLSFSRTEYKKEEYLRRLQIMRKQFLPVIPGLGMPWWFLVAGLNHYFRKKKLPFRASFGVRKKMFSRRIQEMLSQDIPVILAIGQNVPIPWKRRKLAFYEKQGETYVEVCRTVAHFVVITEINGSWLTISSWGRKYYVKIQEYQDYVRRYSSPFVSNIIRIKHICP